MAASKFGAIDIGSNAVRLLISEVTRNNFIKKVSLTRVPLRLGTDSFREGEISVENTNQLSDIMKSFASLLKANKVNKYLAYATSALRNAGNKKQVIQQVFNQTGINIEVISGIKEADLILKSMLQIPGIKSSNNLLIDVGGGSVELSLLLNGKRVESASFNIGTLRLLSETVDPMEWIKLKEWLTKNCHAVQGLQAIGSGGNINRLYKISDATNGEPIELNNLNTLYKKLNSITVNQRIKKYNLKPDRADVIVPAAEIFIKIMSLSKIRSVKVPKIGLANGMVMQLVSG